VNPVKEFLAMAAAPPARGETERADIFDFLMIDEPRDRRFLVGKDFYDGAHSVHGAPRPPAHIRTTRTQT
jgi:Ni,Fe-hydrogenase III component G